MKYTVEEPLHNFQFWSGGKDTANGLTEEQIDSVEQLMEEMSDEWTDTEINDFFWFDRDTIYEHLRLDENGNEIEEDEEPEIYEWGDAYDDETLEGFEVVCWPETQELMEMNGFYDHSYLINDEEGLNTYGSSAYVVEKDWLNENK